MFIDKAGIGSGRWGGGREGVEVIRVERVG